MSSFARLTYMSSSAVVGLLALGACGSTGTDEQEAATFTVSGAVVTAGVTEEPSAIEGQKCDPAPRMERLALKDISISNATGATVARTTLPESGTFAEDATDGSQVATCSYSFAFEEVPEGDEFYSIAIEGQQESEYPRAYLDNPVTEYSS